MMGHTEDAKGFSRVNVVEEEEHGIRTQTDLVRIPAPPMTWGKSLTLVFPSIKLI